MNADKKDVDNYLKLSSSSLVNKNKKLRHSADNGNIESMNIYAFMLGKGEEISVNKQKAAFYYKMADDKGHTHANHRYECMLYIGDGISANK